MRADHVPPALHVDVTVRGDIAPRMARRAAERVAELERVTTGPILQARVVLTQDANRRIERSAHAEAQLLFAGDPVRASVAAPTMGEAIELLV
jgi:hypothetical protein